MNGQEDLRIRLFTGMSLSPEVRDYASNVLDKLRETVDGVRWVRPENLHVTLKYFGWCDPGIINELEGLLEEAAAHLPLRMKVGGIGGFPSQGSAKVIWMGAQDEDRKIEKVYKSLDGGAQRFGFRKERRPYSPHITLGRAKNKPVGLPPEVLQDSGARLILEVGDLVLFRSVLKSTGAEYSLVKKVGPKTVRK